MTGKDMNVPRDVLRFEVFMYASLLLDTLTAAFFSEASEAMRASVSIVNATILGASVALVWLAARKRKNWARWTLFAIFVLMVLLYIQAFGDIAFSIGTFIDMVSFVLSASAFYFAFTSESQRWFNGSNP